MRSGRGACLWGRLPLLLSSCTAADERQLPAITCQDGVQVEGRGPRGDLKRCNVVLRADVDPFFLRAPRRRSSATRTA
jgi:hypothetical protein